MKKKARFKHQVCRIRLNQEQAILQCTCYNNGQAFYYQRWGKEHYYIIAADLYGVGSLCMSTTYSYPPDPRRGKGYTFSISREDSYGVANFDLDSKSAVS